MVERLSSYITIYRGDTEFISVPITASSKVVYALMGEHYLQLDFSLADAKHFAIGDYVVDEVFGKFIITQEQMPTYDTATGGYKYSLKFEAWYKAWNLQLFMLSNVQEKTGKRIRKETDWYLTQSLKNQMIQLLNNLQVIGYIPNNVDVEKDFEEYCHIKDEVATKHESKPMSYSGTHIIDALKSLADTWECEYWIDGTEDKFQIIFGKCEFQNATPVTLSLAENIESMNISKDNAKYADKIYVFGSKDNNPPRYRKRLESFKASPNTYYLDGEKYIALFDTVPELQPEWFDFKSETFYDNLWFDNLITLFFRENVEGISTSFKDDKDGASFSFKNDDGSIKKAVIPAINVKANVDTVIYPAIQHVNFVNPFQHLDLVNPLQHLNSKDQIIYYDNKVETKISVEYIIDGRSVYVEDRHTCDFGANDWQKHPGHIDTKRYIEDFTLHIPSKEVDFTKSLEIKITFEAKSSVTDYEARDTKSVNAKIKDILLSLSASCNMENIVIIHDVKLDKTDFIRVVADNGNELYMVVNPRKVEKGNSDNKRVAFYDKDKKPLPVTTKAFTFRIDPKYVSGLPDSYFITDLDDPSSLTGIGENRLQLPIADSTFKAKGFSYNAAGGYIESNDNPDFVCKNGYILKKEYANKESKGTVETVVIFENVYPDGKLQIESITTEDKDTDEKLTDGSKNSWKWTQYHLTLRTANGNEFPFSKNYVMSGEELKIRFLSPDDIDGQSGVDTAKGCVLAGMTFACGFNKRANYKESGKIDYTDHDNDYAIVRNNDFGAWLPNDILKPNVGDPVVLIGWNVNAMAGLGLVDDAELRLLKKGFEYASALHEGHFTFDCNMMSKFMFDLVTEIPLYDANGKALYSSEDKAVFFYDEARLYATNEDNYAYAIPKIGMPVIVQHPALKSEKRTRVIGYEYKLDKPYDTPKLTIGETEAYSRLKQLEKEITRK